MGNGGFVAFLGLATGSLATPVQSCQHAPQVRRMNLHATGLFQDPCDPRQRPQVVQETMRLRALLQSNQQTLQVGLRDLGRTSQTTTLPSASTSLLSHPAPAQGGRAADPRLTCNFGLTHPAGQQAHAFPPARFHASKVSACLRFSVHGHRIAFVTHLCNTQ